MLTPSAELNALLVKAGSTNRAESEAAMTELAKALELPLRSAVLAGDTVGDIFETIPLNGTPSEFPLDFLAPGMEKDFVAYTIPKEGYIPNRNIEGDYVMVPTYEIANAIDWGLKYARNARWDVVSRAMKVLEAGFTKKINDDAWHCILGAGVDRNIVVYDADAAAGQFTKRLVSLGKTVMRRNGGGNSSSINRGQLTDLYMSPEAMEDIRNWNVDQVDEITRREIFLADDGRVARIFGVNLHDIDELGEGQEYQDFFTNTLSASMAASDVEVMVGLDLSKKDAFVRPIAQEMVVEMDDQQRRTRRAGVFGTMEGGYAVLDGRRVLLLSC